jgi:cleavage and polyadenylation specificity factor subunit 3
MSLVAPEDLREFAGLDTTVIMQRLTIAFHGGKELLKWHLEQMFGGVIQDSGRDGRKPMFKVIHLWKRAYGRLWMQLSWCLNLLTMYL